ncbi:MAG: hypothetical protein QOE37_684 [Microbacteriaceae bacterium]|nr:hypothetical protein [Microbacteriaceae bacterium]
MSTMWRAAPGRSEDAFDDALRAFAGWGRDEGDDSRLALLRAAVGAGVGPDLDSALLRIVEAAVDVLDADYGALVVTGESAGRWRSLRAGLPATDAEAIDAAFLRARIADRLLDDSVPIAIDDLFGGAGGRGATSRDAACALGVPVRVDGASVGSLCVAGSARSGFSEDDARLLSAIATVAAVGVERARLRFEADRHQHWSDASVEIAATLLSGEIEQPLTVLAARVRALTNAAFVVVVRAQDDPALLEALSVVGLDGRLTDGDQLLADGSIAGRVLDAGQPHLAASGALRRTRSGSIDILGPMMAVPLTADDRALGALVVGRETGGPTFTSAELALLADFGRHATVALQLADVRADRQRMVLLEDRARIARDLHDTVIQQLFAAGLELRGVAEPLSPGRTAEGIQRSVKLIDTAIAQIRTAILAISSDPVSDSVRHRILDIVHELGGQFVQPPHLRFDGPVDLVALDSLADDVVAVVRESLTNVAKHASATQAAVTVTARDGWIRVEVSDNGVGLPDDPQRSGLANLEERAATHGGTFGIRSAADGTRAVWSVPYPPESRDER